MSEIKTKIRTYNDVIDLFGEEKAADMLSEALDWSTIDPKNDKKNNWKMAAWEYAPTFSKIQNSLTLA